MELTEAELTARPHELLAELRAAAAAHRFAVGPGMEGWMITGYDDARQALADPRLTKKAFATNSPFPVLVDKAVSQHMLNADPPDHMRLRKLASAAFTARRVDGLRPRVQEITDELLDALAGRETADIIDDFAFPLPFTVICELLGVPQVDRASFRGWSNAIVTSSQADPGAMGDAVTSIAAYSRELIADKRRKPDDALLSALIDATDSGDRLTEDELTSLVFLLLVAGHETTVNLIGNALYLLLQRPETAAALAADATLMPAAIEEVLRFESPVKTSTFRMTEEPVTYGGQTIPAGQIVAISLLSANHDGAVFAEAEAFDPARARTQQNLAFGYGIHYCLGAPLARLEGEIAVGSLLRRFPGMRLEGSLDGLQWRPGILLRGLEHLPVRLS
ncbi:cytochrome P450 [Allocatelliglobosispora scoriae]|uniref:Cytochrome P450 n=1 Tax=Allocatelliglobosispora scoriae TaxID=643052 RepID=A0A841C3L2_9ACTN|nr:cytochrome P450 [Allocatelliglobosispora scoriae]MBB5874358.1 cytochrome P450 [Allocatelliglobosispora scoriae]